MRGTEEVEVFATQIAEQLVVCVPMKRILCFVAVREAMSFRLRSLLSHGCILQGAIGRGHVLMDVDRRDAQGFGVVTEAIRQVIFRQQILQGRVDLQKIAQRVFILQPVESPDPYTTAGTSFPGRFGKMLLCRKQQLLDLSRWRTRIPLRRHLPRLQSRNYPTPTKSRLGRVELPTERVRAEPAFLRVLAVTIDAMRVKERAAHRGVRGTATFDRSDNRDNAQKQM